MRFHVVPFEERILLDAAGAANVVDSYALEHAAQDHAQQDHANQAENPGAVHANSDSVDGHLLVISSQIKDSSLLANAAKDGITVITYDFNTSLSNLAHEISDALAGKKASSIGFALMGADGQFSITSDTLVTYSTLSADTNIQAFWQSVSGMVQNGGSIDILSCNVAIDTQGLALVHLLDTIADNPDTGHYISVNASIDKTGSAALGGNWYLEVGGVDAIDRYFDSTRIQQWNGLLDSPLQVLDINSGSASSNPANFTPLGNLTFFTATTAAAGNELWVTDGTAGGTYMVKDIFAGSTGSSITSIKVTQADSFNVYFIATSSASETSLWKSDGTSAGTIQIANINTSGNDQASGLVVDYVGDFYFAATNGTQGVELWRYSTNIGSPVLQFDINPGAGSSNPTQLTASIQFTSFGTIESTIMFVANNGTNGAELWRNGPGFTPASLVKDINPGSASSGITNLTGLAGYGNLVLFSATSSSSTGAELWMSDGTSAGTVMVSDINPGSASSTPGNFVYSSTGVVYFAATTASAGREIWAWDRVAAPVMVSDINPGSASSNPVLPNTLISYNNINQPWYITEWLFFTATSAANGTELYYLIPGNTSGVGLLDIVSGSGSSSPANITEMSLSPWGNNALAYFTATSTAGGNELWYAYTNGGTPAVAQYADIFVGTTGSTPTSVTAIRDPTYINTKRYLYFSATGSSTAGAELWMVDLDTSPTGSNKSFNGTEDTQLVVNAASGLLAGAVDPDVANGADSLTAVLVSGTANGTLSLSGNGSFTYTPNSNYNGSDSFTFYIRDQFGKQSATYTATITISAVNDAPVAQNASISTAMGIDWYGQLVATDVDSPSLTYSIVTGPAHGSVSINASTGKYQYTPNVGYTGSDSFTFKANDGLLDSNISTITIDVHPVINPPQMLIDANSGATASNAANFTQVGSYVFFTATTAAAGNELWITDGTTAGTHIFSTMNSGTGLFSGTTGSSPNTLISMNGALYFIAASSASETSLFKADPVTNTITQVLNINSSATDAVANLVKVGNTLYFSATTTTNGNEIWKSDGTAGGTVLLKDIVSGSGSSSSAQYATDGTKLFFVANNGTTGLELWTSDGTTAGTVLVKDIFSGSTASGITSLTVINGIAYFSARDTTTNGFELWKSDGTSAGTVMVSNINSGSGLSSTPANFTSFNGKVYFSATTAASGLELWSTDGTAGGTALVKEIAATTSNSSPTNLTVSGTKMFFTATNVTNGVELWVTDGTAAGTVMVKDINAGSNSSSPSSLVALNNKVYFSATNGTTNGIELWVSDGTSAGTTQVMDINPGSSNSSPASLTVVGSKIYFSATDGTYGTEAWVYDPNAAPVATSGTGTTLEDTPFNGNLVANDPDGSPLTYSIVTGPTHGSISLNSTTGAYTYTPDANYFGSDSFTFKVNDGFTDSNVATVNLTINSVNDAPVASGGSVSTAEDTPLSGSVSATDIDSPTLTYSVVTGPAHGLLSLNASTGAYTYTPDLNYNGSDSFTFKANDGSADSNIATINITVTAVNDAPVAYAGTGVTNEDTVLNSSVVATDVDSASLTYSVVTGPAHGILNLDFSTGSYTYTPDANYNGTDSFVFKANDGSLDSNQVTISLTINPVNDAPVAQGASYTINEDTPLNGTLTFTDIDTATGSLIASVVTQPAHGALVINPNGTFTYTPAADYNGSDSFTYRVNDGFLNSNIATVNLTITAVNDAPVASSGTGITNEDTVLNGSVSASDVDSASLTYSVVTGPAHGILNLNPSTGGYTYTPNADYNGPDSFVFKVNDGSLDSNQATINLTVNPVNDAPVAQGASFSTNEDTALNGTLTFTDIDTATGSLTASVVTQPAHGTLVINANGTFTYTPAANYNGSDSFTYRVNDGSLNSNTATVNLTITPVNDAPVANPLTVNVPQNDFINGAVTFSDIDTNASSLVASVVTGPAHGALIFNPDGTFTYTPDTNYFGSDSFTYKINDGQIDGNTQTVNINVIFGNQPPVANNDSLSLNEDTPLNGTVSFSDIDTPSASLNAILVSGPANGVLIFNNDGTFTYTPNANFNGTDSFTFKVNDGEFDSNIATVSLTINAVNDAPVATDVSVSTNEDIALNSSVASAASDVDSGSLTFSQVTGPSNGSLVFNSDGTFTYTPNANYNGSDSFTYKVNDGSLDSAVKTVTITINAVNDAPVANNTSFSTNEDTTLASTLVPYASDVDSPSLTFILVGSPTKGNLVFNSDGTFTYTPNANYNGSDSFTYKVNDGSLDSATRTVSLTINAVNDAPVANDVSVSTNEDVPLNSSVASAASDVDSPSLTFSQVTGPSNGSLIFNSDGTYTYTPNANYNGTDSFTYKANDGSLDSAVKTVTITIDAVNDAPVANNTSFSTNEDTPLASTLAPYASDVDSPSLTFILVSSPTKGNLVFNSDGTFTYTPNANYNGADSFTYKVNDGSLDSATRTVSLTISPVNDAPVATDVSVSTNEDVALNSSVASAASDVDSGSLTFIQVTGPSNGSLIFNSDGSFTYTPAANFNGSDSFTYKVNDGSLDSAVKTVNITINAVNDAPVATDVAVSTNEDTPLASTVAGAATDVDSGSLTFTLVAGPSKGTISFNADGTFTYTPNANYNGSDTFTYKANDGFLDSAIKTVSITINAVNDAPTATDVYESTSEDTPLASSVAGASNDVDSAVLTYSVVTGPASGSLSFNSDGSYTYTPVLNFNGNVSFTYIVNDGSLNSAVHTVFITVDPVNDAPVATDVSVSTNEDNPLSGSVASAVTDVDSGSLTFNAVSGPAHGTLTFNSDGTFTYNPAADFNGFDSFTYKANDGSLDSVVKTVNLTINPVNDAPVIQDQAVSGAVDTPIAGSIPSFDVDGDVVTISVVTGPAHGALSLNPDGSFIYTPANGYSGQDTFSFIASDGTANSAIKLVTVTVDAPPTQVATPPPPPAVEQILPPVQQPPPVQPEIAAPPNNNTGSNQNNPSTNVDTTPAQIPADTGIEQQQTTTEQVTNRNLNIGTVNQEVEETPQVVPDAERHVLAEKPLEEITLPVNPIETYQSGVNTEALSAIALIPSDMLNVATIRGKPMYEEPDQVAKLLLLIGPVVDNIDFVAKQNLSGLVNQISSPATLMNNKRKVRKINMLSSLLESLDLSYAREDKKHITKEKLKFDERKGIRESANLEEFSEEALGSYVKALQRIAETQYPDDQFGVKEALAIEIITKYIVAQNLPDGFMIPFPIIDKRKKNAVAQYSLTRTFRLGNSEIPVYLFEAKEQLLPPILVFRGTRMNFDKMSDAYSIVENFNAHGPARGFYQEFAPTLKEFFNQWFKLPEHFQKFRIFGYSQGGVLGQRAAVDFAEYLGQSRNDCSVFFNSPGIEKDYLEKWNALNPEQRPAAINYVVSRDAVSKVGAGFIGEVYEVSPEFAARVTEAHFGVRLLEDNWKLYKIHSDQESESATRKILNAIQASVLTNGVYQLASKGVKTVFSGNKEMVASRSLTMVNKKFRVVKGSAGISFAEIVGNPTVPLTHTSQEFLLYQNGILSVGPAALKALTTDYSGDVSIVLEKNPKHGVLGLKLDGSFQYTPNHNFIGDDKFEVKIDANGVLTDPIAIVIKVNEPVHPRKESAIEVPVAASGVKIENALTHVFDSHLKQYDSDRIISHKDNTSRIEHHEILTRAQLAPQDQSLISEASGSTLLLATPPIERPFVVKNKRVKYKHPEKGLYSSWDITAAVFAVQHDLREEIYKAENGASTQMIQAVRDEEDHDYLQL